MSCLEAVRIRTNMKVKYGERAEFFKGKCLKIKMDELNAKKKEIQ